MFNSITASSNSITASSNSITASSNSITIFCFFYEDGFGIKLHSKNDMSLNKEIKPYLMLCLHDVKNIY